ncbi:MAG: AAA family ATPase [Spirochaetales bacterium]|nr:AAA family ATPase [Spirochaetales bacterium]
MDRIGEYKIIEKIDETKGSLIYRAKKESEQNSVIVKVLKAEYPSNSEIARFKQEYEIIKSIDHEGIIKTYEIITIDNSFAIILEDFNGVPLKEYINKGNVNIVFFLDVAIKLSETLAVLHSRNIIHKDIKPNNILINKKTREVKITDFGISTVLTKENQEIYNPHVIQGTLIYMAPEQTGRMNRTIDYRADLYSLGITLYHFITGTVPFKSDDPLEIIHSHIAREPEPPHAVNAAIPLPISNIIVKLLLKTPEQRYQNGYGLMEDLAACRDQFKKSGAIKNFELGKKDIPVKYLIPQVILGRDEELAILMNSFRQAAGGASQILLVTGFPGVGKSALIHEVEKPIIEKRGYFLTGKYDQFRKDVHYSAIIQAFQGLFKQILSESQGHIDSWKKQLLKAMGPNGRIITDMIPSAEIVIGKQPDLQEIEPTEAQNRLNYVFTRFLKVFCTKDHPITLFLDDLQWADAASLELIRYLVGEGDLEYFLLIGSYRNNEVDVSHPLVFVLTDFEKLGIEISKIILKPLDTVNVNKLISSFLKCDEPISMPLAEIIHQKTSGTPFFVNQFMKILYDEKIITFDPASGWNWDLEEIRQMHVTDNVVDLLAEKIKNLPEKVQNMLKVCACIGNRFDLELISEITDKPIEKVLYAITLAIDEGLISLINGIYRFHHDRIQEAAYSIIPDRVKAEMHYKIGSILLDKTSEEDMDDKVIFITDHWNRGKSMLKNDAERIRLIELNLMSGKKSKRSTAYESASSYFSTGINLLERDAWKNNYDLAYALYSGRMECEYVLRNFRETRKIYDILEEFTRSTIERLRITYFMVNSFVLKGEFDNAIREGIEGLKVIKYRKISHYPSKSKILLDYYLTRIGLDRKIRKILIMPEMKDPLRLAMHDITNIMGTAAAALGTLVFAQLVLKPFNMYLKYGFTKTTPSGLLGMAMLLIQNNNNYKKAFKVARAAIDALERSNYGPARDTVLYGFAKFILPFHSHCRMSISYFHKVYQYSLEDGYLQYANGSLITLYFTRIIKGDRLDDIYADFKEYEKFIMSTKTGALIEFYRDFNHYYLNMKNMTENITSMNSDRYDEERQRKRLLRKRLSENILLHCFFRMQICFIHGKYFQVYDLARKIEFLLDKVLVSIIIPEILMYDSLTLIDLIAEGNLKQRRAYRRQLRKNMRKIKRWTNNCADNFLHKHLLIKAEIARMRKRYLKAAKLYDHAIESARKNQFHYNEAIANELAAKFYSERGNEKIAKAYMTDACSKYAMWGAVSKVLALEEQFPHLIQKAGAVIENTATIDIQHTSSSSSSASNYMDMSSIIKASQTISREIVLDRLLEKMMHLAMENAGAEKGVMVLRLKGKFFVEAAGHVDQDNVTVLESIPVSDYKDICTSIIHFVSRTKEPVILSNAAETGDFTNDPYIMEHKIKSVLCVPILNQGKLTGLLYFENNLSSDAFTPARIQVLKILSSQIAISIDNARLYANLEDKVKERTGELNKAMNSLWGEMQLAKKIQTVLLPEKPRIKGYELAAYMEPAASVGGDYYDVVNTQAADWVIIGDVSGHGVPAGLIMMMVQTAIHTTLGQAPGIGPSELLTRVNGTITGNIRKMGDNKYMTIHALSVNAKGEVTFAGMHLDILIYRASANTVERIATNGVWIGLIDNIDSINKDRKFTMQPGDMLLLHTDGINEAWEKTWGKSKSGPRKMFGVKKLAEMLCEYGNGSPGNMVEKLLYELREYYEWDDDITLVALKRLDD